MGFPLVVGGYFVKRLFFLQKQSPFPVVGCDMLYYNKNLYKTLLEEHFQN